MGAESAEMEEKSVRESSRLREQTESTVGPKSVAKKREIERADLRGEEKIPPNRNTVAPEAVVGPK